MMTNAPCSQRYAVYSFARMVRTDVQCGSERCRGSEGRGFGEMRINGSDGCKMAWSDESYNRKSPFIYSKTFFVPRIMTY